MTYLNDHHCQVLAKLRALISSALQQLYHLIFHHDPPLCLYRVRDFTFLPHLLDSGKPSKQITVADLAQKILLTTDANIEEVLNRSIERLETQTHYDQQRRLLQRHLEDIGNKPGAAPAPKPPEAHQHKPPKEGQEASYASPQQPDPANMANPRPRSPQRTSGAPSSDGQPPTHNTHISCSEPAAMRAAPSGAYPSAVATPCTSTCGLAEGAPPSGGQPPATQVPTHSHSKYPPQAQQILTELLAKIASRLLDFRCDHKSEQPSSVRHITSWNVGGWTQPGRAGDDKLKAIKASLHKGPIVLQETHWTHEQSTRLHIVIPGIYVVATAATVKNRHPSGGVAIILPVGYEVLTNQTILPGQILAALVQLKGAKIRIISVYLHPDNVQENLQALIKYLNTIDLREWTILAGDFNRADEQCSKLWHQLTEEYGLTDSHPKLPTFRTAHSESCLDRILLPTAFSQNLHLRHSTSARWIGAKLRHGLVTIRLKHKSTVPPDPKLAKHHTIPPYIFRPGMEGPVQNQFAIEAIRDLERRIMQEPHQAHTAESLTTLYWAWWWSLTPEHKKKKKKKQADIAALVQSCLKQKGAHVILQLPTHEALTRAIGTAIDSRPTPSGAREIARTELYKALELLDAQAITYRLAPKNTPEITGDRSNTTAFWQRMRELKTTQGTYNGPIYRANGRKCHTVQDLDQAMIDTRSFWEESPPHTQASWQPILQEYQAGNNYLPPFPELTIAKIQSHLLHTKESAPGLDGIPYAAWRLNPEASSHAIHKLFTQITRAQEEPPSQVLVWIPKATAGPTGDYFRPLGMPNTSHRILDGALSALVVAHCSPHLHPSQSMLNNFREPQKAVLSIQQDLDGDGPKAALFIDMAKAFEKVNPHWATDVMLARGCPVWLVQYAMYLFTGRRVLHKVGGQLLPPRIIRQGVDMGRALPWTLSIGT